MAVERKYNGVRLSFDVVGSQDAKVNGEKPPIIFLHGMSSAKESWMNVIRPIAASTGRKVYTYDARNHGDSGWSDVFSYDVLQEDLLQFMDSTLSQQAILVGHSMGGKTAMLFATNQPKRVEKLIVEDISPRSQPHLRGGALKYVHLLKSVLKSIPPSTENLQEAKKFVYQYLYKDASEDLNSTKNDENASKLPLCQDETGKFIWKTNLKILEEKFLNGRNSTDVKGSFSGPTLVLYGTKSPYKVSADRDIIKRIFPQAQLRAIEGANHQIHDEFGDIFIKEVVDFINDS